LTCLPRAYQNRIYDALDGRSSVKLLLKAMERLVDREKDAEWRQEALGIKKTQKKDEEKKKDEKKKDEKKNDWQKKDKGSSVNSFTTTTQPPTGGQSSSEKNCYECSGQHDLVDCNKFKALPANERLRKAKDVFVHICFRCLKKHGRGQCDKGCRYTHNKLLHGAVAANPEKKKEEVVTATTDVTALTSQAGEQSLRLVKLYVNACDGDKRTICHVTALLDNRSLTTILQEEVARQLGARPNFEDVAITTLHSTNTEKMANLKLQVSPDCKEWHDVNQAKTSTKFCFGDTQLCWLDYVKQDPVFKGVNVGDYNYNDIDLLVGRNVELLFLPLHGKENVRVDKNGVLAVNTKLGWTIADPLKTAAMTARYSCHATVVNASTTVASNENEDVSIAVEL
jgi:hypothetical protein